MNIGMNFILEILQIKIRELGFKNITQSEADKII